MKKAVSQAAFLVIISLRTKEEVLKVRMNYCFW